MKSQTLLKKAIVVSHERSGTHFLLNTLAANFGYKSRPLWNLDFETGLNFFNSSALQHAFFDQFAPGAAHLAKSHHPVDFFQPVLPALLSRFYIFYIYRDPRDVMVSFCEHLRNLPYHGGPKLADAGALMRAAPAGGLLRYQWHQYPHLLARWQAHVTGWLEAAEQDPTGRIIVVRFEDLNLAFASSVQQLANALGRPVPDPIRRPSVENLFGTGDGTSGRHRQCLIDADQAFAEAQIGATLTRLGYASAAPPQTAAHPPPPATHPILQAWQAGEVESVRQSLRSEHLDAFPVEFLIPFTEIARRLGELALAAQIGARAVKTAPQAAGAHNNLGLVRLDQGQLDAAEPQFETALRCDPKDVRARHNLAKLWIEQGRLEAAERTLQDALNLAPNPIAWTSLGGIARRRYDLTTALAHYERALALDPQHLRALLNQAAIWLEQGQVARAETQLRTLAEQYPQRVEIWSALGECEDRAQRHEAALDAYERAYQLRPKDPALRLAWLDARRKSCDWREDWPAQMAWLHAQLADAQAWSRLTHFPPLTSLRFPTTPAEQLAIAQAHARRIAAQVAGLPRPERRPNTTDERLRIGWLSHEFRANVVGHFLRHLPAAFDRARFVIEAFVYNADDGSAIRRDLIAGCDRVEDLTQRSVAEAAARIAARGIHILIDINPYMEQGRPEIAALRPAPVQLSYLYPGTLGAPWIDGILIDDIVVPPAHAPFYCEKLCVLPPCYLPATGRLSSATECPPRAHYGLPESAVVLCCFNRADKIDPETFDAWLRILAEAPETVLWLRTEAEAHQRLQRLAEARGLAPERLIRAAVEPDMSRHLARHRRADLFLDTFIHGAHVTAADALWAGLPLLTRLGATYAGRVAASLLSAAGLTELIAHDTEDYVQRAVTLARSPEDLRALGADWAQRGTSHPLFDARVTAERLGAVFTHIWQAQGAAIQETQGIKQACPLVLSHAGYRAYEVSGRLTEPMRAAIIAFWRQHQVLDGQEAARRIDEVCFVLCDANETVVGVSTLFRGELMRQEQSEPVCFYRTWFHPDARGHVRLAVGLLDEARALLADPQRRPPFATEVLAFETDNARLMSRAVRRLFRRRGWTRLGTSARGRDVWWVRCG